MAVADKNKKFFKNKRFEDIENMPCIWHPLGSHTTGDCRIFIERYTRKTTSQKRKTTRRKKRTTKGTTDFRNQKEP